MPIKNWPIKNGALIAVVGPLSVAMTAIIVALTANEATLEAVEKTIDTRLAEIRQEKMIEVYMQILDHQEETKKILLSDTLFFTIADFDLTRYHERFGLYLPWEAIERLEDDNLIQEYVKEANTEHPNNEGKQALYVVARRIEHMKCELKRQIRKELRLESRACREATNDSRI